MLNPLGKIMESGNVRGLWPQKFTFMIDCKKAGFWVRTKAIYPPENDHLSPTVDGSEIRRSPLGMYKTL